MSRTQDKRTQRALDAQDFVAERRRLQLQMLEQNYEVGVKLYQDQKDTLSPSEIEQIEGMMAEQRAALDKLHEQAYPST